MIPVRAAKDVAGDLRQLPSDRLRTIALGWMARLRHNPRLGQPLHYRYSGDLSTCRKLYFDELDQPLRPSRANGRRPGGPRFRIVYQLLPHDDRADLVRIVAVGLKYDPERGVYATAVARLDD